MDKKRDSELDDSTSAPMMESEKRSGPEPVIDELRQILSNIASNPPKPAPVPEKEPIPSTQDLLGRPTVEENGPIPFSAFQAPTDVPQAPPTTELPSDAEFWKGNVLGWSAQIEDTPSTPKEEFPVPFVSNQPAVAEEKEVPVSQVQVPDEVPESKPTEAEPPVDDPGSENFLHENIKMLFPPAPEPPMEEMASVAPAADQNWSFEKSPSFFQEVVPEKVAEPPSSSLQLEAEAALPPTLGEDAKPQHASSDLGLEQEDLKPKNLVHIAIIVPTGHESEGQNFYRKLREAGLSYRSALNIEAVFIHNWASDQIDMEAWEKSAALSGADFMYVISPREKEALMRPQINKNIAESNIEKKLIFLEQVDLRNLYANLVCRLVRQAK